MICTTGSGGGLRNKIRQASDHLLHKIQDSECVYRDLPMRQVAVFLFVFIGNND
jgi:hypothetical protein